MPKFESGLAPIGSKIPDMKKTLVTTAVISLTCLSSASAAIVEVGGGTTSVDLDLTTLGSVGLTLTGSDTTGTAAPNFIVGFPINSRAGGAIPTTFTYDSDAFAPFGGSLEHTGTVTFSLGPDTLVLGDFTIGYDAGRIDAGTGASGFFVESTTGGVTNGLNAVLFDINGPNPVTDLSSLTITGSEGTGGAGLLVSPELAGLLGNAGLIGATVGSARVDALAIPEPSSAILGILGALLGVSRRRR